MKGMVFVDYTPEQYAFMEKLSGGFFLQNMTDDEREMFTDLDRLKLIQPREDISHNYCTLSQQGLRVLSAHRVALSVLADNVRREQEREYRRLKEASAEESKRKAERRADAVTQILLALLNAALPFLFGVLAEHYGGIIDFVRSLF